MSGRPTITKAVIPAAGVGTRMLPATKALPKEMLPVAGKPLIQYAVEEAAASGIETVILVVGGHKSLIQGHFARDLVLESFLKDRQMNAAAQQVLHLSKLADLRYVEQKSPLGLAYAIRCALPLLNGEPFVVLLPDVIIANEDTVTHQLIGHNSSMAEASLPFEKSDQRKSTATALFESNATPRFLQAALSR
jgi:UTP--glucose-1-phosphate uridylyltransferase